MQSWKKKTAWCIFELIIHRINDQIRPVLIFVVNFIYHYLFLYIMHLNINSVLRFSINVLFTLDVSLKWQSD